MNLKELKSLSKYVTEDYCLDTEYEAIEKQRDVYTSYDKLLAVLCHQDNMPDCADFFREGPYVLSVNWRMYSKPFVQVYLRPEGAIQVQTRNYMQFWEGEGLGYGENIHGHIDRSSEWIQALDQGLNWRKECMLYHGWVDQERKGTPPIVTNLNFGDGVYF